VADGQEESPVVRVGHVADDGRAPEDGADENRGEGDPDAEKLEPDAAEDVADLLIDGPDPRLDVGGIPLEERRLLSQGQHHGPEEPHLPEQIPELLLAGVHGHAAGPGILCQLAEPSHEGPARLPEGLRLGSHLLGEIGRSARQVLERGARALEGQETIRERPDARGCPAGGGGHDRRGAGAGRAELRNGLAQGLDLIREISRVVGSPTIELGQLRREVQLEPAEVETVGRGGQLPIERKPCGGRRGPRLGPQPRHVALVLLDGRPQHGPSVGARRGPGRRRRRLSGPARLGEDRRAGPSGIEGALHRPLRRLLLAAIEVSVEDAAEPLHRHPRVLVPRERALERRHHGLRRGDDWSSGRRARLFAQDAARGAQRRDQRAKKGSGGWPPATSRPEPHCAVQSISRRRA